MKAYSAVTKTTVNKNKTQQTVEFHQVDPDVGTLFLVFDNLEDLRGHIANLQGMAEFYEDTELKSEERVYMVYSDEHMNVEQAKALMKLFGSKYLDHGHSSNQEPEP